jgi:hypothetical protein
MDASDITRKKMARILANIQISPSNAINYGQVPNNPPLTPDNRAFIQSQYPKTDFAYLNNLYPCNSTICSTIYATPAYAYNYSVSSFVKGYYYNKQ